MKKLRSKVRASDFPHKCVICGGKLEQRERPEGFCDKCLRAAQTQPILEHDKQEGHPYVMGQKQQTGTCRICGAETRYAGKGGKVVSELCREHAAAERGLARRGSGETNTRALAYMAEPRRYAEIRDHLGLPNHAMGTLLGRLMRYGLIRRVERGVYVRVDE